MKWTTTIIKKTQKDIRKKCGCFEIIQKIKRENTPNE